MFGEEAFRDNVPRLSYISPQGRLLREVDDEGQLCSLESARAFLYAASIMLLTRRLAQSG